MQVKQHLFPFHGSHYDDSTAILKVGKDGAQNNVLWHCIPLAKTVFGSYIEVATVYWNTLVTEEG